MRPSASLRATCGATLRCGQPAVLAASGVSLELAPAALRQSRALIRWPLRSSAHPEGTVAAQQPYGPSLRSAPKGAGAVRRARQAKRSDGPSSFHPFWLRLRRGACGVGMRVGARMLRHLTRRICPNGAPQVRSELCGAPRKRHDAGLPRSAAQGSQTVGRLSFGYFSLAKQRKVPRPPGRDPASHAQSAPHRTIKAVPCSPPALRCPAAPRSPVAP
jgi:hypothetical protein